MKISLRDAPGIHMPAKLEKAFEQTLAAWQAPFRGLPPHVRFRASGALRAWEECFETLDGGGKAKDALSDARLPPTYALNELNVFLSHHLKIQSSMGPTIVPLISGLASVTAALASFWLRQGAVYEPTDALGSLLKGSDIAQDLPMEMLATPAPALALFPSLQQRSNCSGMHAITVFTHEAAESQSPATRCLTIHALKVSTDEGLEVEELVLPVKEGVAISNALARAAVATKDKDVRTRGIEIWPDIIDYVAKSLLYLQCDGAKSAQVTPYSDADRDFGGLGRKKREAKLAEIDRLYDRYVIGPASMAEWAGAGAGELGRTGELSPHWRRGHFRSQAYGPANSLRKVKLIMPTIVRADLLTSLD